jgi:class 3 adenylate cyclase
MYKGKRLVFEVHISDPPSHPFTKIPIYRHRILSYYLTNLPLIEMVAREFSSPRSTKMAEPEQAPMGEICSVFTDIIDSTNLWEHNQKAMQAALKLHDSIIRTELLRFGGYEVKTLGDGFHASFSQPEAALNFCMATQRKLRTAVWPREIVEYALREGYGDGRSRSLEPRGLRVRMGIHFGRPFSCRVDQLTGRVDYHGPMINTASRIQAEAEGDEIAVSDAFIVELHRRRAGQMILIDDLTHERRVRIIHQELAMGGFRVRSKGMRILKGVSDPEHIFLIVPSGRSWRENSQRDQEDRTINTFENKRRL